jgi:hypothetical protein
MNKRILELAEQAWVAERTEKDPEYKKNKNTEYLLKNMADFHKKFAELLVLDVLYKVGQRWCEGDIKQYFGVEQ